MLGLWRRLLLLGKVSKGISGEVWLRGISGTLGQEVHTDYGKIWGEEGL